MYPKGHQCVREWTECTRTNPTTLLGHGNRLNAPERTKGARERTGTNPTNIRVHGNGAKAPEQTLRPLGACKLTKRTRTNPDRTKSGALGLFPFGCVLSIPEHLGGAFAVHYCDSPFPGVVGLVIVRSENSLAPWKTSGRFACAQLAHGFNADTKMNRTHPDHPQEWSGREWHIPKTAVNLQPDRTRTNPTAPREYGNGPNALEPTRRAQGRTLKHPNVPDEPQGEREWTERIRTTTSNGPNANATAHVNGPIAHEQHPGRIAERTERCQGRSVMHPNDTTSAHRNRTQRRTGNGPKAPERTRRPFSNATEPTRSNAGSTRMDLTHPNKPDALQVTR